MDDQTEKPIPPAELLAALRAEAAESARERGHWNEEAGAAVAPDPYEEALAAAIRAVQERYGLE